MRVCVLDRTPYCIEVKGGPMKPVIDLSKEYGIVLEGGGAKGAYQIGVWKAFREYGLKIKGISGVSVGALNGALMCMGDLEKAERIWENITYSRVMDVDDEIMATLMQRDLKNLSLREASLRALEIIKNRGFDVTPLQELMVSEIEEEKIRNSAIEFYLGVVDAGRLRGEEFKVSELPEGTIKDYLLASAYFPAFRVEKILGKTYLDGGMMNNVPVDMLINHGYKDIIVIRIFGIGREKRIHIPEDVNILEIAPRADLGNMLEFDSKKSRRNMKIGYYDGLRFLCGLAGEYYYIDSDRDECWYLNQLLSVCSENPEQVLSEYHLEDSEPELFIRIVVEQILPQMAARFRLGREFTYKQLYLLWLERMARLLRISRFCVYTEEELLCEVRKKILKNGSLETSQGMKVMVY